MYDILRSRGGCGILFRRCTSCKYHSAWNSGQRITSVIGNCGVHTLEELRIALAFLISGSSRYAEYRKSLENMSLVPLDEKHFRHLLLWMRVFVVCTMAKSMHEGRLAMSKRNLDTVGSILKLILTSDCFWPVRSKKNHCGSSPHGCVPILGIFLCASVSGGALKDQCVCVVFRFFQWIYFGLPNPVKSCNARRERRPKGRAASLDELCLTCVLVLFS